MVGDPHYGRAKLLFMSGEMIESAVELVITFRLDMTRLKQYEVEFPNLGKASDFEELDVLIKQRLLSGPANSAQ